MRKQNDHSLDGTCKYALLEGGPLGIEGAVSELLPLFYIAVLRAVAPWDHCFGDASKIRN